MPKRSNPFGDSSPLQLKAHIGVKEVDLLNEKNMKKVYEKTKSLLFQGAKKSSQSPVKDYNSNLTEMKPATEQNLVLKGQLRIDSSGGLCAGQDGHSEAAYNTATDMETGDAVVQMETNALPAGQLRISFSGQLQPAESGVSSVGTTFATNRCHTCLHPSSQRLRSCAFCEKPVCPNCVRCCCSCEGIYCHLCSTINSYDDCMEKVICVQCVT